MRSNELRIGNLVKVDSNPFESVTQIFKDGVVTDAYDVVNSFKDLEPIPLTEEWLIKFGFEKTSDNMYWVQPDNFMYFELNNFGIIATFPDSVADFGKRVNNVHSLQNLYFALTGEELTIRD